MQIVQKQQQEEQQQQQGGGGSGSSSSNALRPRERIRHGGDLGTWPVHRARAVAFPGLGAGAGWAGRCTDRVVDRGPHRLFYPRRGLPGTAPLLEERHTWDPSGLQATASRLPAQQTCLKPRQRREIDWAGGSIGRFSEPLTTTLPFALRSTQPPKVRLWLGARNRQRSLASRQAESDRPLFLGSRPGWLMLFWALDSGLWALGSGLWSRLFLPSMHKTWLGPGLSDKVSTPSLRNAIRVKVPQEEGSLE